MKSANQNNSISRLWRRLLLRLWCGLLAIIGALNFSGQALAGTGTLGDPFTSLAEAYTVSASGRYYFDLGSGVFEADVDNSEGGGWVLVLQYVHQGGTNPALSVLGAGADLPVTSSAALGTDESAITSQWGHAGNAAMSQFTGDIELRWFGETSNHPRIIHFRSSVGDDYARTGTGSFTGIENSFTPFANHTANIPGTVNGEYINMGDYALTNFPYFEGAVAHWGVRGQDGFGGGANGDRWEVDDFPANASNDTIHRVWVRAVEPLEVTNTNDSGAGSLRSALDIANANAALDNISFNIPTAGPHRIDLSTALPVIDDAGVSIDGTTQAGASCGNIWSGASHTLQIQINGTGSGNVLRTNAANATFRGLSLTNGTTGIEFGLVANNATVQCNYIGLTPDGTVSANAEGLRINANNHLIGGPGATDGNIIAGNTSNNIFLVRDDFTTVQGNFIGVLPGGTTVPATQGRGFTNNFADDVTIDNNLISGNGNFAYATGPGASTNRVTFTNNYFGTDRTGTAALANANDNIHINVSNAGDATDIIVGTPGNGNIISGGGDGIAIFAATRVTIQDNLIGTDVSGSADLGNRQTGITLGSNVVDALIGGTGSNERNIIAGNTGSGVFLTGADQVDIYGNIVGLAIDGTTPLGNDGKGIEINASITINVGDGTSIGRNIVSANGDIAISVFGNNDAISIADNYIGTDNTGDVVLTNAQLVSAEQRDGIALRSGAQTNMTVSNNVVGGFEDVGIEIFDVTGGSVTVSGNSVGVGPSGASDISGASGFSAAGLWVGASSTTVLDIAITGNTIANAADEGVYISRYTGVSITGNEVRDNADQGIVLINDAQAAIYDNAIYDNGGIGVDLGGNGVTENDVNDADSGANNLLNFPEFTAMYADGTTNLSYDFELDVPADANGYRIDFYRNSTADGSGNGEGETHIGSFEIPYDGSTTSFQGSFTADEAVSASDLISATTTRKTASSFDITSEFSDNEAAVSPLVVTNTNDSGVGSLREAINFANGDASEDEITFDIAGAGPHTINLASALPQITDDSVSINGISQSGAACGDLWAGTPHTLQIYISSGQTIFDVAAADVTIRGVGLSGTGKGVVTQPAASNTTVQCTYIGLDAAGASNLGAREGVDLSGAGANIGGLSPGQGNVISGRSIAVFTRNGSTDTSIQGNFIGTDPTGLTAVPNSTRAINNLSGTATWRDITENLISGNSSAALQFDADTISGSGATMPIVGNYIGVDRTGNAALPNAGGGIVSDAGSSLTGFVIGGTGFGERNIISGNTGSGIVLPNKSGIDILGNYIGLGEDGTTAVANSGNGIELSTSTDVTIGDGSEGGRNIISGNALRAIQARGTQTNTSINGNYIGTDSTGNAAVPSGDNTTLGGDAISFDDGVVMSNIYILNNVIGGYNAASIEFFVGSGSDITIQGNNLGVGEDGTTDITGLSNEPLVFVGGSGSISDVTIGGSGAGEGNLIANSGVEGIRVSKSLSDAVIEGNTIRDNASHGVNIISGSAAILSNIISGNGGLGIELGNDNIVTVNDSPDNDGGGNDGLNFPVINALRPTPDNNGLSYDLNLDVPADTNGYRIEFFKNLTPDGSGHGEGEIYLGAIDIVPHAGGDLNFTGSFTPLQLVEIGDSITATATRKTATSHDITSEFAANQTVTSPLVVTNTNDTGIGSLRSAIDYANANNGSDDITFAIPNAGPHTISVATVLPTITNNNISIDGTTQAGASCGDLWSGAGHTVQVRIDGPAGFNGINIDADNIAVKGLSITGFDSGIVAASGSSVEIQCNYVGIAPNGSAAGQLGGANTANIILDNATGSTIGGPDAVDGNVLGNTSGYGIRLTSGATNLRIQNNFVGVDPLGISAAPVEDGIRFEGGNYTVSRLSDNIISGATRDGVVLLSGASLTGTTGDMLVQGNHVGVDRTGNAGLGNGRDGWRNNTGSSVTQATFGGGSAGEGNVFSANGATGLSLNAATSELRILGNMVGVGADGSADLGNGATGVNLRSTSFSSVGDGSADGRNVISGNSGNGLDIVGANDLTVDGNYIGVASDGSTSRPNGSRGIVLNARPGEPAILGVVVTDNVVSNNIRGGIDITSGRVGQLGNASTITITDNRIGVAADGTTAAGNGDYGVKNTNVPGEIIVGGIDPADGNIIANSTSGPGVEIRSEVGTTMAVLSNSIYGNSGIGIDINPGTVDGVTPNDADDTDNGPNQLLNFPVLIGIAADGSTSFSYEFTLDVPDNPEGYTVDFFKNTTPDPTHGEGEIFLGSIDITHGGGNREFSGSLFGLENVSSGDVISATVTRRAGGSYDITSEFAQNTTAGTPSLTINNAYNVGSLVDFTTLEQTITIENTGTQTLTNPDVTSLPTQGLTNVPLTTGPDYDSGDTDGDGNIDIGETWIYTGTLTITDFILNEQTSIISIANIDTDQVGGQASNTVTLPINLPFPLSAPNRCVGTNLVGNGSFEIPVRSSPPRDSTVGSDTTVDDWISNDSQIELATSGFAQNSIIYFSHSGNQHTELNALGSSNIRSSSSVNPRAEIAAFWAHRGENGDDTAAMRITDNDGGRTDAPDFTTGNADWAEYEEFHVVSENASTATVRFSSVSSTGGNSDGNLLDSVEVCQTYITLASAQGTKTDVDGSGTDSAGDTLVYEFTVANPAGNHATLSTVEIIDDKFGTITATPASGDDGDGLLEPGETWVVNYTYTFEQTDVDAESYSSIHFVQADTGNNVIRSDNDNQDVMLNPGQAIDLVKTGAFKTDQDSDGVADAGDVITYTYTVTNNGDVTLTGISVTDTHNGLGDAPALTHDALTDNGTQNDSIDTDGDPAVWEQLGPGDVITFTWDYTVTDEDVEQLQP